MLVYLMNTTPDFKNKFNYFLKFSHNIYNKITIYDLSSTNAVYTRKWSNLGS
jgi:hypothetical protein